MSDESLYRLVNPEFDFEFGGKKYHVRKANLEKAVQYQRKVKELRDSNVESPDLLIVAYCIYLVLRDVDQNITEEVVLQQTPADIDVLGCLSTLGFMSPTKADVARAIESAIAKKQATEKSSQE